MYLLLAVPGLLLVTYNLCVRIGPLTVFSGPLTVAGHYMYVLLAVPGPLRATHSLCFHVGPLTIFSGPLLLQPGTICISGSLGPPLGHP